MAPTSLSPTTLPSDANHPLITDRSDHVSDEAAAAAEHLDDEYAMLRQDREIEFLSAVCAKLAACDLPETYIEEIENDLADTLNQTVSDFFSVVLT